MLDLIVWFILRELLLANDTLSFPFSFMAMPLAPLETSMAAPFAKPLLETIFVVQSMAPGS